MPSLHRLAAAAVLLLATTPLLSTAQTASDSLAIRGAALDYIEGWYTGNADRMTRALHVDLVKRRPDAGQSGVRGIGQMGAEDLIGMVKAGGGTRTPENMRRAEVTILDIYRDIATVRVDALQWVDHLQIARIDAKWSIVNVLWTMRPPPGN